MNQSLTLIIPDAHVADRQDLSRFEALGRLIVDRKPARIVSLGDFLTVESLSAWDAHKPLLMERKRYRLDIKAGNKALDLMLGPLVELQNRQRAWKEKIYKPELVWCEGNHEDRVPRYVEQHPAMEGYLDVNRDLQLEARGFTHQIPYREFYEYDEVLFTHVPMNGANKAPGGVYALRRVVEGAHKSVVFGHLHRAEGMNVTRHGLDDILQIRCSGAFFEHTDTYAKGALNHYWRGVEMLHHWRPGRFDVEQISIERMRQVYA